MSAGQGQAGDGYTIIIPGELASYRLSIPGRLPGLNEYTEASRANRYKGGKLKQTSQELVSWCIRSQLRGLTVKRPVFLLFTFYEKDRRRDHDNVASFARKVIQDALVDCGTLYDDGWEYVTGYLDRFEVDTQAPRIVVEFIEQEGEVRCSRRRKKSCPRSRH